jgi:hypothetical protein
LQSGILHISSSWIFWAIKELTPPNEWWHLHTCGLPLHSTSNTGLVRVSSSSLHKLASVRAALLKCKVKFALFHHTFGHFVPSHKSTHSQWDVPWQWMDLHPPWTMLEHVKTFLKKKSCYCMKHVHSSTLVKGKCPANVGMPAMACHMTPLFPPPPLPETCHLPLIFTRWCTCMYHHHNIYIL